MPDPAAPPLQPTKPDTIPQRPALTPKPKPQPGTARKGLTSS